MSKTEPKIILLGGEGIGPEVIEASARVIQKLVPQVEFARPIHGEAALKAHGTPIPEETQKLIRSADSVLFGATFQYCGEVLRYLRWGLQTYANIRPAKTRPRLTGPLKGDKPIDMVIVRENMEGEYPTREGSLEEFTKRWPGFKDITGRVVPEKGAFAMRITTEEGCKRISEFAVKVAKERQNKGKPGKITIVTKENVLRTTDGMFRKIAQETCEAHGLKHEHYYVDDACRRLVAHPETIDVIVCPNLFGDVMSDISAELVGGLGMAPSGCVGAQYSYFESVHGSAPDIAGKGIANPMATLLSAVMMLDTLHFKKESEMLENAINHVLSEGKTLTPDLGGKASTEQVADAIIASFQ